MIYHNDPAEAGLLLEHSPYGFRVNINHPAVLPLYKRYKHWKGIPGWCPLSDSERLDFEKYILPKLEATKNES
jgi:hypothetical protein